LCLCVCVCVCVAVEEFWGTASVGVLPSKPGTIHKGLLLGPRRSRQVPGVDVSTGYIPTIITSVLSVFHLLPSIHNIYNMDMYVHSMNKSILCYSTINYYKYQY